MFKIKIWGKEFNISHNNTLEFSSLNLAPGMVTSKV